MSKIIYLVSVFSALTINSYASSEYDDFNDIWKRNTIIPSYERLFFDGHNVFLKNEKKKSKPKLDNLYQKNIRLPDYDEQEILSIDHKGETITLKKPSKGKKGK